MTILPDFSVAGKTVLIIGATVGIRGAFSKAFFASPAIRSPIPSTRPELPFPEGLA
jgi:hypothetical protein